MPTAFFQKWSGASPAILSQPHAIRRRLHVPPHLNLSRPGDHFDGQNKMEVDVPATSAKFMQIREETLNRVLPQPTKL